MEKRIELEKRGRSPDTIKEICLDNCRSAVISGLDDSFVNLEVLSMINIGLTSLKNFPKLPNLKRLELSDNRIANGLNYLTGSPNLEYLNLCGNRFKDLESLEPLKELKHLEILDLFNCEVTELENYREHVFNLIPNLKYLDGYDRNNKEIEDEDEDNDDEEGDEENGVDSGEEDDDDEEGDEDDSQSEGDEDDEEDSDLEDEENEVGLAYLAGDVVDEENEENEFVPGEEDDEDDLDDDIDDEEEDAAQPSSKGEKRKLDEDGEEENAE